MPPFVARNVHYGEPRRSAALRGNPPQAARFVGASKNDYAITVPSTAGNSESWAAQVLRRTS